jgi:S-methylmethionine-dependent homocysteine/selenocysteine methylase
MNNFEKIIETSQIILTEGGIVERIRRNLSVELDPFIAHAGLIYEEKGRDILQSIFEEYFSTGKKYNVPILSNAPTWRINPERLEKSNYSKYKTINKDCVEFIKDIRKDFSSYSKLIFIGGIMACKGDAYNPKEALLEEEAEKFHIEQAESLANSGVDFIKAATLPALSEAYGMASAISRFNIPYILSFVIRAGGKLLDGTYIHKAIELIDSRVDPKPIFYMINCVHPAIFTEAIKKEIKYSNVINRLKGFQANTSAKSPEELDNLTYLDTTEPDKFAELMISIHKDYGIKILGGCCGSDNRHINEIAKRI